MALRGFLAIGGLCLLAACAAGLAYCFGLFAAAPIWLASLAYGYMVVGWVLEGGGSR